MSEHQTTSGHTLDSVEGIHQTTNLTLGHVGYSPDYKRAAREVVDGLFGAAPLQAPPAQIDPRDAEIARLRADMAKFQRANDDLAAENVALRDALGAGREWLEVLSPPPPESISGQRMDRFRNLLVAALELGLD